MNYGKHICKTLKAIRSEIASANEIEYTPIECHHKGDCAGTCPACESEMRWLERQLRNRQALGKAVTIAGLSVALGAMSSCHMIGHTTGKMINNGGNSAPDTCNIRTYNQDELDGYIGNSDTTFTPLRNGKENVAPKGNDDDQSELMGEVGVDENGNAGELNKNNQ